MPITLRASSGVFSRHHVCNNAAAFHQSFLYVRAELQTQNAYTTHNSQAHKKKKNTRALKITQVFFSYSCGSESNKLYTSTRGHKRLLYVRKCFFLDNVANTSLQLCSQTQKKSQHPVFPRRGKGFLDADHKKTTVQDSRRQNTVGTENKEVNPPRLPCCLVPS